MIEMLYLHDQIIQLKLLWRGMNEHRWTKNPSAVSELKDKKERKKAKERGKAKKGEGNDRHQLINPMAIIQNNSPQPQIQKLP